MYPCLMYLIRMRTHKLVCFNLVFKTPRDKKVIINVGDIIYMN